MFAPLSLAYDGSYSSSDPSFVYSQSYTFEYQHLNEQQDNNSHQNIYYNNQPPSYRYDPNEDQSLRRPTLESSSFVEEDHRRHESTEFEIVYNDVQPCTENTWVSRVEQEFQTDAYAFESPFDVRFFSEEELEKRQEDESDDDEDDDDNDGSCSMLSNASISRVQVTSHEESSSNVSPVTKDRLKIRGGSQTIHLRSIERSSNLQGALSLRGGAAESVGSEVLKRLYVSALVTLAFEACMGHIFEFLKIVMQTSQEKTSYTAVVRDITSEKGIGGLWDGFVPWGVVQAVSKGAVFGFAHTTATRLLMPLADSGTIPKTLALTLAGGIGGGVQGFVLSPLLLLKTRVMTNPIFRQKQSLWKTSMLSASVGSDIVRTEGIRTLMKGSRIFATKRVFDWATRYYFAELIEAIIHHMKNGQPLSLAEKSLSSFLGGVLSTCFTLPLDVLVAKTQDAKKAGIKVSPLTLFTDELREKGLSGLSEAYLRGFTARLLHVCLTVVAMKTLAPVVYDVLFG